METMSKPELSRPASKLSTQAFLTLLLIGFIMGANHVCARFAFNDGLSVMTAVWVRSSVTSLIILGLIVLQRVPRSISSSHIKYLIIVGILITIQSTSLYASVARMPVALALLAFNTYPLFVALLARLIYKEVIEQKVLWLMPVILVGLGLALDVFGVTTAAGALEQWRVIGLGVAFALTASLSFSFALLLTQHRTSGLDGRIRSVITLGMVSLLTFAICMVQGGPVWPQHFSGWIGLLLLTILYGTGFTIMFTVLPRLGAVGNTSIMNVEPVCALVLAWLILDQHVSISQILGALIVVTGAIILGLRK